MVNLHKNNRMRRKRPAPKGKTLKTLSVLLRAALMTAAGLLFAFAISKIPPAVPVIAEETAGETAAPPERIEGSLKEELDGIFEKYYTVGAQAAVIRGGRVSGVYHYGFADKKEHRYVTDGTKYRVASLSKLVSAMVFTALEDRGIADRGADISDYFGVKCADPFFADVPVTADMLMSHTASLRDFAGIYRTDTLLNSSGAYYFIRPGTQYNYSNLGYGVLACVCEAASGRYFTELADEYLFEPLGTDAAFLASELNDTRNLGALYEGGETLSTKEMLAKTRGEKGRDLTLANGNLTVSAKDYAKILTVLLNGGLSEDGTRVLSEQGVKNLLTLRIDTEKYGVAYGSQIEDTVLPGRTVYVHTGSAYGMYSVFVLCPEERSGAVVLTSGAVFSEDEESEVYDVCLEAVRAIYAK